jgi:hypothetical protein
MLLDQFSDATDLNQSATEYGVSVKTATGLVFSSNQVTGLGKEPFVVGASFAVDKGETTKAFLGNNSLFMVRVDEVTPAILNGSDDVLLTVLRSKTNFQLYQALEELSEVTNNISTFY